MTVSEPEPLRGVFLVGVGLSLVAHLALLAAVILVSGPSPPIVQKRGEPLFVDLAKVDEPAPRGNPAEPRKAPARPRPARPPRRTAAPSAAPRVVPSAPTQALQSPRAVPPPIKEMPGPELRVASLPRPDAPPPPAEPPVPQAKERAAPVPRLEARRARPEAQAPPAIPEKSAELPRAEPRPFTPDTLPARDRPSLAPAPNSPAAPPERQIARPEMPVPRATKEAPSLAEPVTPREVEAPKPDVPVAPAPPPAREEPAAPPPPAVASAPRESVPASGSEPAARGSRAAAGPARGSSASAATDSPGDRVAALPPASRGGGLRDGRGGIEGTPIPLDTKDPRFGDYFDRLRRAIKAKWSYPREAAERNIGGQLVMEFGIAKNGHLRFIEVRRSSGVPVLDAYAVNAVKLASPFPPIPDEMSRAGIPVLAVFNYIIDIGALNNFLR